MVKVAGFFVVSDVSHSPPTLYYSILSTLTTRGKAYRALTHVSILQGMGDEAGGLGMRLHTANQSKCFAFCTQWCGQTMPWC